MKNICHRNQMILKDEKSFANFITGHYKMSNTRNKEIVNIVCVSKQDLETSYNFNKFCDESELKGFIVVQHEELGSDKDIFYIIKKDEERIINNRKLIKREVLFF